MPAFHLHLSAILLPALIMLAGWLAPASMLNRRPLAVAKTAVWLTGLLLAASAAALTVQSLGLIGSTTDWRLLGEGPMASLVYYDGVSGLGVLLVSFVGFVVCQYSRRYLAGDPRQGDYFRWTGATVGAVTIAMLAGNLLLLFAAWLATSLSLHRLLLHYPERRAAQEAAWTKFAVSRLGDCLLLAAAGLVYREFGTLNLGELFQAFSGGAISTERAGTASTIGMLLACAAVAKSAQFPFHIWLPNTLETPTPVSALMHAGIVNAGGYMMIRLSPIIVQAPLAMATLLAFGALTVLTGGLSMAAQSSVKRMLAYSTVAQMGFMMLQCGLGAFSAAMLHLVAHSFYKAYAFLNSGNVLTEAQAASAAQPMRAGQRLRPIGLALALIGVAVGFGSMLWCFELDPSTKPGGIALAAVLCIALLAGAVEVLAAGNRRLSAATLIAAPVLSGLYLIAYLSVDRLVQSGLPSFAGPPVSLSFLAVALFLSLLLWQASVRVGLLSRWFEPLYVHALNGFYVESAVRRVTRRLRSLAFAAR